MHRCFTLIRYSDKKSSLFYVYFLGMSHHDVKRNRVKMECPFCHKKMKTRVQSEVDLCTIIAAIIIFMIFCPLACVPFCCSCVSVNCQIFLKMYSIFFVSWTLIMTFIKIICDKICSANGKYISVLNVVK